MNLFTAGLLPKSGILNSDDKAQNRDLYSVDKALLAVLIELYDKPALNNGVKKSIAMDTGGLTRLQGRVSHNVCHLRIYVLY